MPPTVARTCSDGQTQTQKTTEMESVSSAAKNVTPMSGPNISLRARRRGGEHGARARALRSGGRLRVASEAPAVTAEGVRAEP